MNHVYGTSTANVNKTANDVRAVAATLFVPQGEWGMTELDEQEARKRSVKFVDCVIPDTRAQLKVLAKSYQVQQFSFCVSNDNDNDNDNDNNNDEAKSSINLFKQGNPIQSRVLLSMEALTCRSNWNLELEFLRREGNRRTRRKTLGSR